MRMEKAILERLYSRKRFGIKPGLEVEKSILEFLGNPQKSFAVIHVAGTNGKGSVCAILASVLKEAGIRVGLYTSPHLIEFSERIQVDGRCISDREIIKTAELVDQADGKASECCGREATFFEFVTAMAFEYFKEKGVSIAVVETGMGGRFDATNVVEPVISIITNISMEHSSYLGDTIEKIAFEKAGIIKPGRPVVCSSMDHAALEVIRKTASERSSQFIEAAGNVSIEVVKSAYRGRKIRIESSRESYGTIYLPLAGDFQVDNLACAIVGLEQLENELNVMLPRDKALRGGVENVKWPGRFELIHKDPAVLVDCAHNPDASRRLADSVARIYGSDGVYLILGMCKDKDVRGFLNPWRQTARKVWVVDIDNERNYGRESLAQVAAWMGFNVEDVDLKEAAARALSSAREGGMVCVTGSLFLVGEFLAGKKVLLEEN